MNEFQLRKKYWRLHNNFYGLVKKDLISENEKKIMLLELKRAERSWKEEEENVNNKSSRNK